MTQKIVGFTALESFWGKLNKWLQANFESLFKNDEDLENDIKSLKQQIDDLTARIVNLENTDFTTEDVDNVEYDNI